MQITICTKYSKRFSKAISDQNAPTACVNLRLNFSLTSRDSQSDLP